MIDRADIATRLVEERARIGYSQADFARALGVSRETVRRYEIAATTISAEFLAEAVSLGMDVQYILVGVRSQNMERAEQAATQDAPKYQAQTISVSENGDVINTHTYKKITKAEVKPGDEHISEWQASRLKKLVDEVVETEERVKNKPASHRSVWSALNHHCGVTTYRLIPEEKFVTAEKYLRQRIGRLNASTRAVKSDGAAWRQKKYAYIKINTKGDEEWLNAHLKRHYQVESLTELDNNQLEKLYRSVSSRKSRRK